MENVNEVSYFESLALGILKANKQNNVAERSILLQQLTEAVATAGDIGSLIGPVVKLLPCHSLEVKRTIYYILPQICSILPDTALLILNTIRRDIEDPNPSIKCLAMTAFASISPLHHEYASMVLNSGLNDGNPKVRITAVTGCATVHMTSPQLICDEGFIDKLYATIRDSDPIVVSSCLIALDTILASEGGVVVNRNIAWYLLKRLKDFPAPQLATVLQVLCKYQPKDETEMFRELSILDPFLVYPTSAAVVVNCIRLFLRLLTDSYPNLKKDVIQRSAPVLRHFICAKSSKETVIHVLDFLLAMKDKDPDWLEIFGSCPNAFFPKENTDYTIATKQLQVLPYITNSENFKNILKVLKEKYCKNKQFGQHSIICVGIIAQRLHVARSDSISILISLLETNNFHIVSDVLSVIQSLDISYFSDNDSDILINRVYSFVMTLGYNYSIPKALPQILGQLGKNNKNSPYILEMLAENFLNYENELQLLILICAVRLFVQQPAIYQHSLGEVLEKCILKSDNMLYEECVSCELSEKAKKYYSYLKSDVKLLEKLLFNCNAE